MKDTCKFCALTDNKHEADCSRDTPNADALYSAGWQHGHNSFAARQPNNRAYMAGYNAGLQGPDWWAWEMLK